MFGNVTNRYICRNPVLFDSNVTLFFFIYFDQAIDIALVATFLLETLPPVKSSERESRQSMAFFLAILLFARGIVL